MNPYKIVFCDIDGTLLDSKHRISGATRRKVQELERIGVPFILVSARMPSGIFPVQAELCIKAPIVCYSGGLILDGDHLPIMSAGIQSGTALSIKEYIDSQWSEICCSVYSCHDWIVDNASNFWVVQEQAITRSEPKELLFADYCAQDRQIHKLLCMGQPDTIYALNDDLASKYPDLAIYRSKDTYLEIMGGTASKSKAVRALCARYDVPVEHSVSFGDNFNDVDMLQTTGMSYAMGNAHEQVKKIAKRVTLDNDQEGVLAGLNQLLFNA